MPEVRLRFRTVTAAALASAVLLVAGLLAAGLLAGCGSAQPRTGTTAARDGLATFSGDGYSFQYPVTWGSAQHHVAGGVSSVSMAAPGHKLDTVTAHYYPHPSESVSQALADDLVSVHSEATSGQIHGLKLSGRDLALPGAKQAKLLTETYTSAKGPTTYKDLVVTTDSGAMLDLEVLAAGQTGFDPDVVIQTLRLN